MCVKVTCITLSCVVMCVCLCVRIRMDIGDDNVVQTVHASMRLCVCIHAALLVCHHLLSMKLCMQTLVVGWFS